MSNDKDEISKRFELIFNREMSDFDAAIFSERWLDFFTDTLFDFQSIEPNANSLNVLTNYLNIAYAMRRAMKLER